MSTQTEKEVVFDALISPLVVQVLRLCKEHGISMVAHFDISGPEDPELLVSSQLADGEGKWSELIDALPGGFLNRRNVTPADDKARPGLYGEAATKEIESWKK